MLFIMSLNWTLIQFNDIRKQEAKSFCTSWLLSLNRLVEPNLTTWSWLCVHTVSLLCIYWLLWLNRLVEHILSIIIRTFAVWKIKITIWIFALSFTCLWSFVLHVEALEGLSSKYTGHLKAALRVHCICNSNWLAVVTSQTDKAYFKYD